MGAWEAPEQTSSTQSPSQSQICREGLNPVPAGQVWLSMFQPPFPLSTHLEVRWSACLPIIIYVISPEVSLRTVVRVNMENGVFTVILGRLTIASNVNFIKV